MLLYVSLLFEQNYYIIIKNNKKQVPLDLVSVSVLSK